MAWSVTNSSNFQFSTATTAGAAGTTTGVPGWTDIAGNNFNIVTPASIQGLAVSGQLITYAQCAYTGVSFLGQQIIRPASETPSLYSRHIIRVQLFTGEIIVTCRTNATGTNYYGGTYGSVATGNARVFANVGGTNNLGALTIVTAAVASHTYDMDLTVQGASPTIITMNVYDVSAGYSLVAYGSFSDSSAGLQVAGANGICQFSAGTTTLFVSAESFYATASNFGSSSGIVRSTASNIVTCGVVATPGGTAPYTYKLYRDTIPNVTGTGTLLQTVTAPTPYTDTAPGAGTFYYVHKINDTGSANTGNTTQVASVTPTAYVIGAIGDSLTQGQESLGVGSDACSQLGIRLGTVLHPALVTVSNQGVGGTASADWISGNANLTNAVTAIKAAATAAGAGAQTYVQIMLGTNDSKNAVASATYSANLASAITYIKGAGIAGFKGIVLHVPPAIGAPAPIYYGTGEGANGVIAQYAVAIAALVDNVSVFKGDTSFFGYSLNNQGPLTYSPENLHLSNGGYGALATAWAKAYVSILNPITTLTLGSRFIRRF